MTINKKVPTIYLRPSEKLFSDGLKHFDNQLATIDAHDLKITPRRLEDYPTAGVRFRPFRRPLFHKRTTATGCLFKAYPPSHKPFGLFHTGEQALHSFGHAHQFAHILPAEHFHHFLRLLELVQHFIDFLNRGTRTGRDAAFAACLD